jgi:hypothetical protein
LNPKTVSVHELIAWGLDEYPHRDDARQEECAKHIEQAQRRLAEGERYASCPALLEAETKSISHLLSECGLRSDLHEEYEGLDWTLGVVDLRRLLAFQRRLVFSSERHASPLPHSDDWSRLIPLALGPRKDTKHRLVCHKNSSCGLDVSLYSTNPDLQLRLNPPLGRNGISLLSLYGGSPFFEVATFRDRWFLRDGYHRAYRLLHAGVHRIPAVVIYARTIGELGATEPWFFQEDQLFSNRPPRVMDFLDESMILRYERVALHKVIRIRIEESLQTLDEID